MAGNLAIVVVVFLLVARQSSGNNANFSALSTAEEAEISNPLDTVSAADIAVNVAIMAQLPETGLIINHADSVSAELSAPVAANDAVMKPQILSSAIKTKEDIQEYVVEEGDTLSSLAKKFGVTSESIKWSNSLGSNAVNPGVKLLIPPVNGIVYTVKSGDTVKILAEKFNVSKEQIIQFNDAELTGIVAGEQIVIPGGTVKVVAPKATPFYAGFAFGNSAIYGYNGYVPGYCTWYVANKRIQIGRPLPANLGDAFTWDDYAARAGIKVDRVPEAGAAVVTGTSRRPGHVAYVEEVYYNEDKSLNSVKISEMNARNIRYEIRSRIMTASEALSYNYVH